MKNKYKEIFNSISPDEELINSITEENNFKKNTYKTAAVFCCVFAVLFGIGTAVHFNYTPQIVDETDIVNLIVAYETRKHSESDFHISKELNNNGKKIKIDADVVVEGNISEMCIYEANEVIFSADEFESILYGENGLYKGDVERASVGFPNGSGITFGVSVDEKEAKKELESKGEGYAKGCNISYEDAKRIADEFVKRKKADEYHFIKGEIANPMFYGNGYSETGFYIFSYSQYTDGFPLETVSANVYSGDASELSIYVNDDGIIYLRMCGLNINTKKELNGDVMSVNDAVKKLEETLPELWLSEYAPIVEIRLEYMLDQLDDGTLELVPCWHFCIDETELKKMSIDIQRENDTNDLCVNAVTGEMFRVGNRYPVYQMSDGSIVSTWQR